jgi:hypothetical protein
MPRPKSDDPVRRLPIYMRRSQIERLEARADKLGVKAAALAAEMVEQGLDLRENADDADDYKNRLLSKI